MTSHREIFDQGAVLICLAGFAAFGEGVHAEGLSPLAGRGRFTEKAFGAIVLGLARLCAKSSFRGFCAVLGWAFIVGKTFFP